MPQNADIKKQERVVTALRFPYRSNPLFLGLILNVKNSKKNSDAAISEALLPNNATHQEYLELFTKIADRLDDLESDYDRDVLSAESEMEALVEKQAEIIRLAAQAPAKKPQDILSKLTLWKKWCGIGLSQPPEMRSISEAIIYSTYNDLAALLKAD